MNRFRNGIAALSAMAAFMAFAPGASAQEVGDPIITFHTRIYDEYGAQNAFHIELGATTQDYFDIDCGAGLEEIDVEQTKWGSSADGGIGGTAVSCIAGPEGIVKIYGDASKIDYISVEGCYIDWIDMEKCTNLAVLNLQHNELQRLDLTPFSELQAIYMTDNPFTAETPLKVGGNKPYLQILELDIIDHIDQSFNLSDYPALRMFNAYHNRDLRKIDPTGCPELLMLTLEMTDVETVDVSKNPKLIRLNVSDTRVSSLDVSKNPALEHLLAQHVSGSINTDVKIKSLDLTSNPALILLNVAGNEISSIDLSKNTALTSMSLRSNKISEIDLTANTSLYSVDLAYNLLDFATLPMPGDGWGEYYYQRSPLECARSYALGETIDFSSRVLRQDTETTARVWIDPVNKEPSLLDEADYTYADGKITFNAIPADSVYVEFLNSSFSEYSLRSGNFKVKNADEMGKPSKVLGMVIAKSMAGKEFGFKVGMDNASASAPATFYVDLGDGEMKEFHATSAGIPSENNFTVTLPATLPSKGLSLYIPENASLTALEIKDMSLTSIDLSAAHELRWLTINGTGLTKLDLANNRCLQTLDISGNRLSNVTLKGVFGDYEKNVLSEINASGNRLFSFTVTATTQLRKLDLSDNMLTSFTLKNYDSLVELDLSGNRLKDELNLAYLANAERIDLSNNAITTLVLDKMPALKSFDVTGNNLTLATVPYIEGIADGVYTYAPQKKYELAAFAPGVNLTSQNRIIDGKGTVFTWKKADGTVLVEGFDYSCADGATKFLKEDLGKVYCEMTNPAFPQFIGENAYMTTEVTVTGAPSILVASFTTLEDSDKGEVVFTGNKTSDLYIDWRGDGTEYIQYPINGSNYSSYAGQTTYKGAEVKVYTYESPDDVVQFSVYDVKMGKMDASPMKNLKGFSVGGAGLDESTLVFPSSPGLEEISLPGNSFSTKAFREFASLHHLVLTGNRYQSFDASGMTGLETLMLSDNELKSFKMDGNTSLWGLDLSGNGMESVDLSGAPVLSQIMLNGNKLSAIDLSPVKDVLVAIDLQRNAFNFATLPNRAEFPNLGVYLFVNQAPVAVECHDGMVDLSAQASVNGTPTEFRCFIGDVTIDPDTGELVGEELDSATANPDDPEFTVDNGVLSFRYVQDKPVVCVMTNGEYPNLLLYTLPFAIDKAGVDSVIADGDADAPVDVYTVAGVKVRSHVATADATRGLAPGFYIVGTRKVLVK